MLNAQNEPAFFARVIPNMRGDGTEGLCGISVRDYFACSAMQALLTGVTVQVSDGTRVAGNSIAANAYRLADAMIAERQGANHG